MNRRTQPTPTTAEVAQAPAHAPPRLAMWAGPSATIVHQGTDLCRRLRFGLGIPADSRPRRFTDLCPLLGLPVPADNDGYPVLMAFLSEPCPLLAALPPVTAVDRTARGEQIAGFTDDPRLTLGVLARCSGHVFLRDRSPSLSTPQLIATVDLLVPRSWKAPA